MSPSRQRTACASSSRLTCARLPSTPPRARARTTRASSTTTTTRTRTTRRPHPRRPPPASASPPLPEALAFLKVASPADALVDRLLLFKWPVVGWCVGKIMSRNRRNTDARKTAKLADGSTAKKNFNIFYEIDGEEVGSVLRADEYGGDDDFSWVLLEPAEGA